MPTKKFGPRQPSWKHHEPKSCHRISGKYSFSRVKILWLRIWHWPHSTHGAWPDVWLSISLSSTQVASYRIPMEVSPFNLESLKSPQPGYFDIQSMTLWISQESFCVLKLSLVGWCYSCDNHNRYFLAETFSFWSSITPSTMTLAVWPCLSPPWTFTSLSKGFEANARWLNWHVFPCKH